MSSKIEWCDETWNPVTGCTPVSEGCENCYAERMAKRLAGRFGYPKDEPFRPGTWHNGCFGQIDRWRKPRRVFVCSMGDLFHDGVHRTSVYTVLAQAFTYPVHTWMVLTKRPERMRYMMADSAWPDNLWLGVTAENQCCADERIPILLETPTALRFVSVEPMLEYVDISKALHVEAAFEDEYLPLPEGLQGRWAPLDWVICGPETGSGKRPFDPEWARDLHRQCQAAGVAYFYKGKDWQELGLPREFPE